jgi:hypothetical protein
MPARTSASRLIPALVALVALGGCAPLEGDEELLLAESEDASPATSAQQGFVASNLRLRIGDLPSAPVKKVANFEFENEAPRAGRIAPERTVEIVFVDAGAEELELLLGDELPSALLTSFDDEGRPVMEMHLVGVRLIGHPRAVGVAGPVSVKLGYDALSMGTP